MPNDNLQKLKKLFDIIDDETLTRTEFTDAFEKVVNLVLKVQEQQAAAIASLESTYDTLLKTLENKHGTTLDDLKKQVDSLFVGDRVKKMEVTHSEVMRMIDGKMKSVDERMNAVRSGRDGRDGKDGIGKDGSPDSPKKVRDKLESLTDDERLDISAIKGIEELVKKDKNIGKFLGGVLQVGVRLETPVGAVNGSNTSFTVFKIPRYLVVDGVTYFEDNGYTLSGAAGRTVTTSVPPTNFIRSFY